MRLARTATPSPRPPSGGPPTADSRQPTAAPQGLTLVELLVVIVLISILVATVIPVLAPGGDERRLREASRNVNAYLQGAQARAIQTGRPFGVALRRASEDTQNGADNAAVVRLEYVEVPPAYAGFDDASLARVCVEERNGIRRFALQFVRYGDTQNDGLPAGVDRDLAPDRFFRPGDEVHIGGNVFRFVDPAIFLSVPGIEPLRFGQGDAALPVYQLYETGASAAGRFNTAAGATGVFRLTPASGIDERMRTYGQSDGVEPDLRLVSLPGGEELASADQLARADAQPSWLATRPMPFKVYRQPVPAAGEPLEMPSGTAIDLQASVLGNGRRLYNPSADYVPSSDEWRVDDDPIMVLFSPEGSVDRIVGVPDYEYPLNRPPTFQDARVKETVLSTTWLALLVGRRSQIPADPTIVPGGAASSLAYANPIDLGAVATSLSEEEAKELTDQFNWLNLESRWVVVGGQSGAITTVDNTAVYVPPNATGQVLMNDQLRAALENAPRRTSSGGR
ncbi:prepilin-type N-terminal cleavage/methylation domain-containing protein [Botrimarina sp.]|uniref:prepilin-type N-terminal cleavage/methylation domain-containing protein n=1 Tax=Botrimarina sp. TaxID=2795802 RepID=UPI0032EFCC3A